MKSSSPPFCAEPVSFDFSRASVHFSGAGRVSELTPRAIWAGLGSLAGAILMVLLDFAAKSLHGFWEEFLTAIVPTILALLGAYFAPASPVVPVAAAPGAPPAPPTVKETPPL